MKKIKKDQIIIVRIGLDNSNTLKTSKGDLNLDLPQL